jgi:3-oxoacyl-[acyl-carrier protein] reductase
MNSARRLEGKTALVTGAGRGLGAAIAARLAAEGAGVAVNDVDADAARHTVQCIVAAGARAHAVPGSIADPVQVEQVFQSTIGEFGGIDILVNNAGIVRAEDIFATTLESWQAVIAVNLTGSFLCSKLALQCMRDRGKGGRIIFIGSMVGHQGALKGWVSYGASKSGMHGLAKTLSRTAAPLGVTVNVVAPGIIETEMLRSGHGNEGMRQLLTGVPLGTLGSPDDVAAAVSYLASDDARYVTGTILDVNGGMYVRA